MERSILVKAETIEEAIRLGLSILDVEQVNVEIEVLSNPGRSLFGFRKNDAEVRVTTSQNGSVKESGETGLLIIRDKGMLESAATFSVPQESLEVSVRSKDVAGARLINGEVECSFSVENYPVIEPQPNVRLFVNNEQVKKRVIIKPGDEVLVKVSDELIPPSFRVKLIEQDMLALIAVIPGKKVKRELPDTDYERVLRITGEEHIEYYNDINPQAIVDELKLLGVQKGLIFSMIKKATEVQVETEMIVAKGVHPILGIDGDFVLHVGLEVKDVDEFRRVDFRERNSLLTVRAGELIATYTPATPGENGFNLLGKVITPKQNSEIIIRMGNHVEMVNNDIVAKISGKPSIERRNRYVQVDVFKEFFHNGEVDLKSGNIQFEGDVRIKGNVHPSMYVSASGAIQIAGSVTKATIHSAKEITISKNVFTSTISVGKQNYILGELAHNLGVILQYLGQLQDAVRQILLVRDVTDEDLTAAELNHLIRLLLEKKYSVFQDLNKNFIQKVKNHSMELSSEWVALADKYYNIFIHTASEQLEDVIALELLIEEGWVLVELYSVTAQPKSFLSVPYAINSELYCNGDILITSKGLYHSFVTAGHNISVKGVCRGGELFAENQVILHESGSKTAVRTVIRTSEEGSVRIGFAYAGTEVFIGNKKHVFKNNRSSIYMKLDQDGNLFIG